MKKWIVVLVAIVGCAVAASAQDLRPVGADLSTLLGGLGQSVITNLQQAVLSDNGVGVASLGNHHFYFGMSVGAALSHGLLGFVNNPGEFQVLDINGLITNNLPSSLSSYYSAAQSFFPDPNLKVTLGVRLLAGIEVFGIFSIVPEALPDAFVQNVTFNSLTAGVLVRKVLIEDSGYAPAISLGVGYTYANLNAGYSINNFSQNLSGSTLTLGGNLKMGWTLNTAGLELDVSKRLLIFVPYVKFMPWYQWASFSGSIDNFTANLSSGSPTYPAGNPSSNITLNDISFLMGFGVEIELGPFRLVPNGSYNIATNTLSANLSMRGQF